MTLTGWKQGSLSESPGPSSKWQKRKSESVPQPWSFAPCQVMAEYGLSGSSLYSNQHPRGSSQLWITASHTSPRDTVQSQVSQVLSLNAGLLLVSLRAVSASQTKAGIGDCSPLGQDFLGMRTVLRTGRWTLVFGIATVWVGSLSVLKRVLAGLWVHKLM